MSFRDTLQRLRDASEVPQPGIGYKMRAVRRDDLAELLQHFDRLDSAARRDDSAINALRAGNEELRARIGQLTSAPICARIDVELLAFLLFARSEWGLDGDSLPWNAEERWRGMKDAAHCGDCTDENEICLRCIYDEEMAGAARIIEIINTSTVEEPTP